MERRSPRGGSTADGTLSSDPHERPTPQGSQQELLDALEQVVRTLIDGGAVARPSASASRPGSTRSRTAWSGRCTRRSRGIDLAGYLEERLGVPVVVDNDGNVAAVAEWQLRRGPWRHAIS